MLHAVIMAGGSGTRFWPASRQSRPKQFLSLASDRSLLRLTFDRIVPQIPPDRIWVVTAEATVQTTRELLPELPSHNVLGEPEGRDTAACVGLAALAVARLDRDGCCVVLPADNLIPDEEDFRGAVRAAARFVTEEGGLLTFGLRPTAPETGFGYLKLGREHRTMNASVVHHLQRFEEKPDFETATRYVKDGGFLWNSGMFVWMVKDLLAEIDRQLPMLAEGLRTIAADLGTDRALATIRAVYPTLPRISVDYGVMEGASKCWCLPVDFRWSDVGSWPALRDVADIDENGNACRGRVVAEDCENNVLISQGPVVATVGLRDLVVVALDDAVLVVPCNRAQAVKDVVAELRRRKWFDVL